MSKRARPELLADADLPRLYSIDSGRPFLADLADGLIDAVGHDLARAEIFLPTRRALRAAADAILGAYEARGVNAALLPRFRAIGDIEEDELAAFAGDIADEIDILPAISPTARLVTLARFVAARDRAFAGHENWPAAIAAARELGKMLDSFYTEEIDFSAMKALNVEDAAGHWARALHFLDIVAEIWPQYLRDIGRLDPADRRARLIGATARRFAENPPGHPVLIAGSTASAPAVARLVAAIARAPIGAAILPGLDRAMDARARDAIDDAHPQSGLKALLRELGAAPEAVRAWPKSGARNPRTHLLTLALRPAEATDEWLSLVTAMTADDAGLAKAARGLNLVEADNEELEAAIIAALFRETVEAPGKTAFLVTPDRRLARRVALKMRRWNIDVDDSAGVPFANTPCGTFLRLLAAFMDDPGDPVAILALLRHPFARLRLDDPAAAIDAIDAALRGVRPAQGLASLEARLKERETPHGDALAALALLRGAADLAPRADDAPFAEMFDAHLEAAELVAGEDLLWSGRDGEAGAQLLSELRASADDITAIGGRRYADVFSALIAGAAVRRPSAAHPRLAIFGPLEARLQCADRIILGGLNEGVWPQDAASDPFLSRRMRKDLGLPSPERRIGLSAHDFEGLAAQGEVFLTRSKRADGKPANPSRWIVRLKNILTGAGALGAVDRTPMLQAIAKKLDAAQTVARIDRPRPKAGPGRRPERVSVTQIEKWLRDPYSLYARYLLGLRKIED
ncbi:MAG: double-strand break repair protein AddB, partial [Parvularculaceae bacterium]|nr:double-strand break repair protein AddB [Parvularculaceae bacterium]